MTQNLFVYLTPPMLTLFCRLAFGYFIYNVFNVSAGIACHPLFYGSFMVHFVVIYPILFFIQLCGPLLCLFSPLLSFILFFLGLFCLTGFSFHSCLFLFLIILFVSYLLDSVPFGHSLSFLIFSIRLFFPLFNIFFYSGFNTIPLDWL